MTVLGAMAHRGTVEVVKVLHLVHAFQTGGAERVVLDLVHYSSTPVTNFVCSFQEPCDLALQLDRERTGFRCLHKRDGNDLRTITALARLIDEEAIDVVHAQGWGTFIEGLVAAKWRATRRPAFIHAFHGKTMEDVARGIPLRRRIAQRIAHHWTDACIAPARHMAEDYAQTIGLSRERVELIHNGIDLSRFGRERHLGARTSLGLGPEDFVVGFAGRLDRVKNIRGLVEIFAGFRAGLGTESPRARLLIVGDGPARADAERAVDSLGLQDRVLFTGLRTDVPQCMAAMDAYLQPSFYEGLSVTLLEALATGLPVVSTAVGGTPELIRHGENGLIFQPEDQNAMSQALQRLFRQPQFAAELGRRGREQAEHFSVRTMVERYENLYRRVLKTGEHPCAA